MQDKESFLPNDVSSMYTVDMPSVEWDTGLCGCCGVSMPSELCCACVLPCLLFARINKSVQFRKAERPEICDCSGQNESTVAISYCLLDLIPNVITAACGWIVCGIPCICMPLSCMIHQNTRRLLRLQNTRGPIASVFGCDVLITFCCPCCALLQEYTQVQKIQNDALVSSNYMT